MSVNRHNFQFFICCISYLMLNSLHDSSSTEPCKVASFTDARTQQTFLEVIANATPDRLL